MVDGSFDYLCDNPKNDEDLERVADGFFIELYKCLERAKVLLKDELLGFFT